MRSNILVVPTRIWLRVTVFKVCTLTYQRHSAKLELLRLFGASTLTYLKLCWSLMCMEAFSKWMRTSRKRSRKRSSGSSRKMTIKVEEVAETVRPLVWCYFLILFSANTNLILLLADKLIDPCQLRIYFFDQIIAICMGTGIGNGIGNGNWDGNGDRIGVPHGFEVGLVWDWVTAVISTATTRTAMTMTDCLFVYNVAVISRPCQPVCRT